MNLAPVVLFVYNRPWHTLQVLEALHRNELASESKLFVFCDGAKENAHTDEFNKIEAVRSIVKEKKWCSDVVVSENKINLGLSKSVINGVSEVLEQYNKVIVLEDDIVVGKYFLNFMNEVLTLYENESKVYGISGYKHKCKKEIKEDTFFLPIMSSWGYATWRDRWSKINFNGKELLAKVESKSIGNKLNFNDLDYYSMLKEQVKGLNDSWAVRFYVSMYLDNGFFLYPKESLLKNIGFDGSGVHCFQELESNNQEEFREDTKISISKQNIELKRQILKLYNNRKKKSPFERLKRKAKNNLPPEILQLINRKFKKKNDYEKMLKLPRYTETSNELLGVKIKIPDNASYDFMFREIFKEEIYKFKSKREKPYIIDGGANIGLASIYFKKTHPNAEIVAFEPDKNIFKYLKSNIESFKFDDVTMLNKGLWNEEKKISFFSEGADSGKIQELDVKENNLLNIESIKVTSLKSFLNRKVDFLKLDIEGAETVVLKDIASDLHNVEKIFVEYHSFVNQPQSINQVIDILSKANFRLYMTIPGNNSIKSPYMGLKEYNNMDFQLNIFGYRQKTVHEIT